MIRSSVFPRRYVQGRGALRLFGQEVARYGKTVFCLVDAVTEQLVKARLGGLESIEASFLPFTGHCTRARLDEIVSAMRASGAEVIAGFGGGATVDIARAAAHEINRPYICAPTIAASDAPCSGISILYDDSGVMLGRINTRNPDVVLVDTAMIAEAPVRFFVAGIGDGLATWYEAESCRQSFARNVPGERGGLLAQATATLCRDVILSRGRQATKDVAARLATPDVDAVVEASVLMSGVGFESCGVAAAHAIHNGLTEIPETKKYLHGEKVAYGLLASLFLSAKPDDLRQELFAFCADVGLPVQLAQIGIDPNDDSGLMRVAEKVVKNGGNIANEPFDIEPIDIVVAMKAADNYGKAYVKG